MLHHELQFLYNHRHKYVKELSQRRSFFELGGDNTRTQGFGNVVMLLMAKVNVKLGEKSFVAARIL